MELFEQLNSSVVGDNFSPKHPLLLNLALLRVYHSTLNRSSSRNSGSRLVMGDSENILQKGKKYMMHASASYGFAMNALLNPPSFETIQETIKSDKSSDIQCVCRMTGLDEEDILEMQFQSTVMRPCYMICRCANEIIWTIRGTCSIADVITDLVAGSSPFLDGEAHKGILEGAKVIIEECRDLLRTLLEEDASTSLTICGHSLGAGTATLITMMVLQELASGSQDWGKLDASNLRCFAFAPPPVYTGTIPPPWEDHIYVFINSKDVVPTLSAKSIHDVLQAVKCIDKLNLTISQRLQIVWDHLAKSDDAFNLMEFVRKMPETLEALPHGDFPEFRLVGNIYWVHDSCVENSTCDDFTRILLGDRMVKDHMTPAYETCLGCL